MGLPLRSVLLLFLVTGTFTQDLNLFDALDDTTNTPDIPKEEPKVPPKAGNDDELSLLDAFGPDVPPTPKTKKPSSGDSGGFNLEDAFGPDLDPKPDKPAVKPPNRGGGGGGSFDDSDLFDIGGDGYKPDGGSSGGSRNPGYDPRDDADQPKGEAGSGQIAGIASAIGVALMGAASSYIAYQKKKLCFKMQGGADPERGKGQHGTYSEPQVLSNLLQTN